MFNKKTIKLIISMIIGVLGFYMIGVLADDTIGNIANRVTGTFDNIAKLITAGAYVAGAALTVLSLFKFKQHKENPQQAQLGTSIVMLLVGICLIFLPSIIKTGGESIYGTSKSAAGVNGTSNLT